MTQTTPKFTNDWTAKYNNLAGSWFVEDSNQGLIAHGLDEGTARKIEAAPRMRDALAGLLQMVVDDGVRPDTNMLVIDARAALALAEGKS